MRFHQVGDYDRKKATAAQAGTAHNAITNLVATVENYTGILPYTNLCNECIEDGIPTEYPAALWALSHDDPNFGGRAYIGVTGGNFTLSGLRATYGKHKPEVQGITLYNGAYSAPLERFLTFAPEADIIVDEAYFNSSDRAKALRRGTFAVGKPVLFVTQWPLTEAKGCKHVDYLPVLEYGNWIREGF